MTAMTAKAALAFVLLHVSVGFEATCSDIETGPCYNDSRGVCSVRDDACEDACAAVASDALCVFHRCASSTTGGCAACERLSSQGSCDSTSDICDWDGEGRCRTVTASDVCTLNSGCSPASRCSKRTGDCFPACRTARLPDQCAGLQHCSWSETLGCMDRLAMSLRSSFELPCSLFTNGLCGLTGCAPRGGVDSSTSPWPCLPRPCALLREDDCSASFGCGYDASSSLCLPACGGDSEQTCIAAGRCAWTNETCTVSCAEIADSVSCLIDEFECRWDYQIGTCNDACVKRSTEDNCTLDTICVW
ncbi:hypothetical protein DIPPA_50249, partial [Diplonema papillatum]